MSWTNTLLNRRIKTRIQLVRFCTSCTFPFRADDCICTKWHLVHAADVYIVALEEGHLLIYLVVCCNYSSIFLKMYLLATPVFSTMWFCGLNPLAPPPLCVPKISQEMSMATLINGGYYVNMGKLMTNYLLKVYCTMKYLYCCL